MKLSGYIKGDVEKDQQTLCRSMLSKGSVCNFSGAAKGVKLRILGYVEVNQKTNCKCSLSKGCICSISGTAKGIK